METEIDLVDETSTTSIITFLKAVPASIAVADGVTIGDGSFGSSCTTRAGKASNCLTQIAQVGH